MSDSIPHFKFIPKSETGDSFAYIEMNGEVRYEISDLTSFYKQLGYSNEMALKAMLPDDFILENYFNGDEANPSSCFQMHIVAYLLKRSSSFKQKYGEKSKQWFAEHAESRNLTGEYCHACKKNESCSVAAF